MTLTVGYIGAGNFSSQFIHPQLSRHDVRLAAICDLVEEKAQRSADKWGFETVYTNFERMCDEEDLDAVFCVGGPAVHYEVGCEVLRRGMPLYVQKPPASDAARTREMADIAAKQDVVCHVGFNFRSSPAVRMTREFMDTEEFGRPTLMVYRYGLVSGDTWRKAIHDQHCHAVDTILYLMGECDSITATPLLQDDVRGYVAAMRMKSGAVASLNTTSEMDLRDEFAYFEVTGENGHYVISHGGDLRYHRRAGHDMCLRAGTYNHDRLREHFGYIDDVANFLAAVRGDEADRSPVADTVATMELCEEIYRQCRKGGAPE
ncbi:MAG: Gfo/Idh/MocA family protein [Armatimonadota bacterium]